MRFPTLAERTGTSSRRPSLNAVAHTDNDVRKGRWVVVTDRAWDTARVTPKGTRSRHRRRWWAAGLLGVWTLGAWYAAADSHRAYERCEAHPGPGIVICTDGSVFVWVIWAIPLIVACIIGVVVLWRRMIASVDKQVDDFAGTDQGSTEPR